MTTSYLAPHQSSRQAPDQLVAATDVVSALVTLERPQPAHLADHDRGDKYTILFDNTQQQRTELLHWIEAHGLADEVLRVGASTTFNLLFVCCTLHAADQLAHAPGVKEVTIAGDCERFDRGTRPH